MNPFAVIRNAVLSAAAAYWFRAPRSRLARCLRLLRDLGCKSSRFPSSRFASPASFRPLDAALQNIAAYDWLILTSVNGVDAMFERMAKKKVSMIGILAHLKIAAIGPATKAAIEKQA